LLSQFDKNSYFTTLKTLFLQYCNQIKLFPDNLYRTIQSYKAKLSSWYPIPKIHNNPITARPICEAFNTFTTYASQVINKVLKELYLSLLAKYPNHTSPINTICPDTDTAIIRANLVFKHCSPYTPIHISSFDFEGLYPNIPVSKAISLILSLYTILEIDPLHEFEIAINRTKNDSYNRNLQKMQQTLLTIHPLKINKQTLQQLMQLVLIDNSYLICEWIPFQIFQQTSGITMGTNCAVHFANLSLAAFQILNKKALDTYCPFMSRYIDDILTISAIPLTETANFLIDFYKPLNLNLIPNTPKNNITVYLDIQLYTPQFNNIQSVQKINFFLPISQTIFIQPPSHHQRTLYYRGT
jgi:hypothetical protein